MQRETGVRGYRKKGYRAEIQGYLGIQRDSRIQRDTGVQRDKGIQG